MEDGHVPVCEVLGDFEPADAVHLDLLLYQLSVGILRFPLSHSHQLDQLRPADNAEERPNVTDSYAHFKKDKHSFQT